jgi:outer membrane lipoprotein-sorting protein
MKVNVLLIAVLAFGMAGYAAPSSAKLYSDLERHLQSRKSLDLEYEATGTNVAEGGVSGHMVWARPDKFYHDTPEWTLCETGPEQWRYLKTQNTLIREAAKKDERWTPESVLLDLGKSFRAQSAEELEDGRRTLLLQSSDANAPGEVTLEFPPEAKVPDLIRFRLADGTVTEYRITNWKENVAVDPALFTPPDVPAENTIDFRTATEGGR